MLSSPAISCMQNINSPVSSPLNRIKIHKQRRNKLDKEELRRKRNDSVIELRKQRIEDCVQNNRKIIERTGYAFDSPDLTIRPTVEATLSNAIDALSSSFSTVSCYHRVSSQEELQNLVQYQISSIQLAGQVISNEKSELQNYFFDVGNLNLTPVMGRRFSPTNSELVNCLLSGQILRVMIECVKQLKTPEVAPLLIEISSFLSLITSVVSIEQANCLLIKEVDQFFIEVIVNQIAPQIEMTVCEHAFIGLSNIMALQQQVKEKLINNNFISPLFSHVHFAVNTARKDEPISLKYIQSVSWALKCICYNDNMNLPKVPLKENFTLWPDAMVQLITLVKQLLIFNDDEVTSNVLASISYLTVSSPFNAQLVGNEGLIPLIIDSLDSSNKYIQLFAAATLANLAGSNQSITLQIGLGYKALEKFASLLLNGDSDVQREVALAVVNITAEPSMVQRVFEVAMITPLIEVLHVGDMRTHIEATYCIRNIAANGNFEHLKHMVSAGVIDALATMLQAEPKLKMTTLKIYERLFVASHKANFQNICLQKFEESAVEDTLERLCDDENKEISDLAILILDKYVDSDQEDSMYQDENDATVQYSTSAVACAQNVDERDAFPCSYSTQLQVPNDYCDYQF